MNEPSEIKPLQRTRTYEGFLSGSDSTLIWLALHDRIRADEDMLGIDPLSAGERKLYEALTAKFTFDTSLLGFTEKTSSE